MASVWYHQEYLVGYETVEKIEILQSLDICTGVRNCRSDMDSFTVIRPTVSHRGQKLKMWFPGCFCQNKIHMNIPCKQKRRK